MFAKLYNPAYMTAYIFSISYWYKERNERNSLELIMEQKANATKMFVKT